MNRARHFALPLIAALTIITLLGCTAAEQPAAAASSAPEAKSSVTITGARLVLPAVPGNPGAAYFALNNDSTDTAAIAGIAVTGAGKTEMHTADMTLVDRAEAEPRTTLTFEPGKLHVMVYDVSADLKAGSETELTVTLTTGAKIAVPAKVEGMGAAAMGDMSGMDHKP